MNLRGVFSSGQGFYLAFGLEIREFYTMASSAKTLARMALGDFDYEELEASHQVLGPAMFWMYIFLMFFILMSVFIALIAESYEHAKSMIDQERDARQQRAPSSAWDGTMIRVQQKVQRKMRQMCEDNLISPPLEVELRARMQENYDPQIGKVSINVGEAEEGAAAESCCGKLCRSCHRRSRDAVLLLQEAAMEAAEFGSKSAWRAHPVDLFSDSDSEDEDDALQVMPLPFAPVSQLPLRL